MRILQDLFQKMMFFYFDWPNLDCLADFNLTELLGDFDDGEGVNYFCQTDNGSSPETFSG